MKRGFKVVLATLMLAVFAVGFSSFATKKYNDKAFDLVCFVLTPGADPTAAASWNPASASSPTVCPDGTVFCGICFDSQYLQAGKPNSTIRNNFSSYSGIGHGNSTTLTGGIQVTTYEKTSTP